MQPRLYQTTPSVRLGEVGIADYADTCRVRAHRPLITVTLKKPSRGVYIIVANLYNPKGAYRPCALIRKPCFYEHCRGVPASFLLTSRCTSLIRAIDVPIIRISAYNGIRALV